eukprot:TRINITY_DN13249_c0_g1_i1.p1 TRINITY_DN13249_c0_g1~~TRINITY_DN13249_c0_g1_i1.p1  ORF type:complete len:294 (-),score=67.65 TRINITY_DN13249_c0_g1_i1:74-934(-)
MKALYEHDFPVPTPVDFNRHCIVMSRVNGYLLAHVKSLGNVAKVYTELMQLIVRFAQYGLIHCDFNEFNLMINDDEEITVIDFPQMISTDHVNAEMFFDRDVACIKTYFTKKYNFEGEWVPKFSDIAKECNLDVDVEASGFTRARSDQLGALLATYSNQKEDSDSAESDDSSGDDLQDETQELSAGDDVTNQTLQDPEETKDTNDSEEETDEQKELVEDSNIDSDEVGGDQNADDEPTDEALLQERAVRERVKRNLSKNQTKRSNKNRNKGKKRRTGNKNKSRNWW